MARRRALADLCAALNGAPRTDADWMAVLWLANGALVTPQLHAAAERAGTLDDLPEEVRTFTAEVWRRNRERNRRLLAQLDEALAALNAVGVEPVLLKGAAIWASLGRPAAFDRMMNDLDLLVRPDEVARALEGLQATGFPVVHRYEGADLHVIAERGRPSDVGVIDLHQRAPGPPGLAETPDLTELADVVEWNGVRARLPQPAVQAWFLVLHDQIHDGDYWRGGFALRHLLDLAMLAEGIDWGRLRGFARTRLAAHVLDAQLVAAHRLAGAAIPDSVRRSAWARLQYARHMAQFCWPALAAPLAAAGAASETFALLEHRRVNRADRRRLFGAQDRRMTPAERLDRLRYILGGLAAGKL
jgi:hypothetical protein